MKIVIDNSGYGLDNIGDLAMLQVAVERLSELWPDGTIYVISADNNKLTSCVPNAEFFSLSSKKAWLSGYNLIGGLRHLFPKKIQLCLLDYEGYIKTRCPSLTLKIISWRFGAKSSNYLNAKSIIDLISNSDLVVATGGGYVNDTFSEHSSKLLDVLLLAQHYQKPTVMLGQGLGPLSNKNLVRKFKSVLTRLELISLREGEFSPKLLKSLINSINNPSILVTGDDAVEKSYKLRAEYLGGKIGLNIRNASYATLPTGTIEKLGGIIQSYIHKKETSYQLLPISLVPGDESDINALINLMHLSIEQIEKTERSLSVNSIIQRVSECRVVITGSYHAALFALSQGVQVIGLTASNYYDHKFMGLLKQFEVGVQILYLNEGIDKLSEYLDVAWARADEQRDKLLERAEQQVRSGKDTYLQLKNLVK